MFVTPSEIYKVDTKHRAIDTRDADGFELEIFPEFPMSQNLDGIHVAKGLHVHDFGLFLSGVDSEGVTIESFLMTNYLKRRRGIIVPSDDVIRYPDLHLTPELSEKIAMLPYEEMEQFGLACLSDYVRRFRLKD